MGLAVSSTSLRKPSIISRYHNVGQGKSASVLRSKWGFLQDWGWQRVGRPQALPPHRLFSSCCLPTLCILGFSLHTHGGLAYPDCGLTHSWILLIMDFQYSTISKNALRITHPWTARLSSLRVGRREIQLLTELYGFVPAPACMYLRTTAVLCLTTQVKLLELCYTVISSINWAESK